MVKKDTDFCIENAVWDLPLSSSELFCTLTEKENAIIWEKSLPEVVSSLGQTVAAWKDKSKSEAMQGGGFLG